MYEKKIIYFPTADNIWGRFPSGLVERFVKPIQEHVGPKALLSIAWSNAWGAISTTIASFGTWEIAS